MKFSMLIFFLFTIFSSDSFAKDFPGDSIFHLKGTWTTSQNKKIELQEFAGKTLVVAMMYTSCEYSCPLIIQELRKIEKNLPESSTPSVHYLLASIDPERDTSKTLQAFAKKNKFDLTYWTLITGSSDDQVRELSSALGINYKKSGSEFAHSNAITILNGEGVVEFSKPNLGQQMAETVQAIVKLGLKRKDQK